MYSALRGIALAALGWAAWLLLDSFGTAGGLVVGAGVLGGAIIIAAQEISYAVRHRATTIVIHNAPAADTSLDAGWGKLG